MRTFEIKEKYDLEDYRALIHMLRAPGGCPWDREQTHESIRRNVLEEAYETAQAIDSGDRENLREELGDLLMQVLLHADMEEEAGTFDLDDVADTACRKLVFRHPHVFGGTRGLSAEAVARTWEQQKMAEKGQKTVADTLVSVAETLPALWRAEKIQNKAAEAQAEPACTAAALHGAVDAFAADPGGETLGELLFAAVAAARNAGIDPETALHAACSRFICRFAETHGDGAASDQAGSGESGKRDTR